MMGNVDIKIYSWLSNSFTEGTSSHAVLNESFQEGESLRDLFNHLSDRYPPFAEVIFDRKTQGFFPHVNFIYRGKAADAKRDLGRKLQDGDEIIFVPIYAGG